MPLARYAVFVCPILSGSGVRVKLLEAFAAGIPVVSTQVGAEGLAVEGWRILRAGGRPGRVRRARARALRESRGCRRDGGAGARRSGGQLGYGRDHPETGGGLPGHGEGEAAVKREAYFFATGFMSFFRRGLQCRRPCDPDLCARPLGGLVRRPDHLPRLRVHQEHGALARPNEEFCRGLASLFTVSVTRHRATSVPRISSCLGRPSWTPPFRRSRLARLGGSASGR